MVRDRLIDNGREERRLLWPRMCIGLNKDFSHFFLLSAFYRYSTDLESDIYLGNPSSFVGEKGAHTAHACNQIGSIFHIYSVFVV